MRKTAMMTALAALAFPATALAQMPPDAAKLKAIEAQVPPQSWYPDGYYDVRIAAEAEREEARIAVKDLLLDWDDGLGKRYDVIDCGAESPHALEVDAVTARYGFAASEVARIRSDLGKLKIPAAAYAEPLLAFEKKLIEEAALEPDPQMLAAEAAAADAAAEAEAAAMTDDAPMADAAAAAADAAAAAADAAAAMTDEEAAAAAEIDDPYTALAKAVEANRKRLAPKAPPVVSEGGCGAGGAGPVIVKTVPPQGEVLLVNAFAFKVCTRKVPDPWDRFACKWMEIETGVQKDLSGNYVYQVRWPDGTVRKGTRFIVPQYDTDEASIETFKKTGS